MHHPATGHSEDDLSRLTSSSSSITSSSATPSASPFSTINTSSCTKDLSKINILEKKKCSQVPEKTMTLSNTLSKNNNNKSLQVYVTRNFTSSYLPEFINPFEWQKTRKRKERLDSTTSTTQERKLQRSNSEEILSQETLRSSDKGTIASIGGSGSDLKAIKTTDVIRRVSSEEFKKTPYSVYLQDLKENDNILKTHVSQAIDENDSSLANRNSSNQQQQQKPQYGSLPIFPRESWVVGASTKDRTYHMRSESSPARSPLPTRTNVKDGDTNECECEHERRRSSERFSKSHAPPVRKAPSVIKKGGSNNKYLLPRRSDENVYKYNLSTLKNERRGFISKKVIPTNDKSISAANNNYNENDLGAFSQNSISTLILPIPSSEGNNDTRFKNIITSKITSKNTAAHYIQITSAQDPLPWDRSIPDDQTPVLSRRYAPAHHHHVDSLDTAAKLSKVMPYPQRAYKQNMERNQLFPDKVDNNETIDSYQTFTSLDSLSVCGFHQHIIPSMTFQSPEERLKQINKRITAIKKKLNQLQEAYESRMGYRPSQGDRLSDKYMKNILVELNKLRQERHQLKSNAICVSGVKIGDGISADKKLEEMKATLLEIEQNLIEKRADTGRSEALDEVTADHLLQEKTLVQHGLLYFESQYGRPATKDERDIARPLYDRYRQLKRMVSRSVTLSNIIATRVPELPTILEHEAMVYDFNQQQYSSNNSTDTTDSPSDSMAPIIYSDDSTTTVKTTEVSNETTAVMEESVSNDENISTWSIPQLWAHLDATREEKKFLKRTIREFEMAFEQRNGRKMLKSDRKKIEDIYTQYKEKKAKTRLLQALINKHISR